MALSGGDTLFIAEGSSRLVKIHPAVLFSVLDHYMRRNEGQVRVIGTLLGVVDELTGNVEVTDCFAVQHSDKQDEVFLDKKFQQTMSDLHLRVNPKERVVGWYATSWVGGVALVDSSSLIHDFYADECEGTDPVHLVVDTALVKDTVGVKAYVSTPLSVAGMELANMFHQIAVEVVASEPERICLDHMIDASNNAKKEKAADAGEGEGIDGTAAVAQVSGVGGQELKSLQGSAKRLLGMVEEASSFVDGVVGGSVQADDDTGRRIADALASVPRIQPEVFDRIFNENVQDLLMVSYLASLTKSQLAIAEQLNAAM